MNDGDEAASARPRTAIGLMSGTSLDGIDAALLVTCGERVLERGPAATFPYREAFRDRLRPLLGREPEPDWQPLVEELTLRHADAVRAILAEAGLAAAAIDVVGFHGQTVWHRPARRRTVQIGDGALLARRLGIPVVTDFRGADVEAGGQGAPLVPLYHAAVADELEKPVAVLNVGGVANLTWIGADAGAPIAFDTGPGNALLDDWVRLRTGRPFDHGGRLAAAGSIDSGRLSAWLRHDFFRRPPPKSLDRDEFAFVLDALRPLGDADGAATLSAFTARAVAAALPWLPQPPRRWLVCGGGRHNPVLLAMLREGLGAPVEPAEVAGLRSDFVEAEAFAFLAVRSLRHLPLTLPTTTGAPYALTGGRLHLP